MSHLLGLVGLFQVLQPCVVFAEGVDVLLVLPGNLDIALLLVLFELKNRWMSMMQRISFAWFMPCLAPDDVS